MNSKKYAAFSVTDCELLVIPGTKHAFIRLALVDKPLQRTPTTRRYVFSRAQLAGLRDEIDAALYLCKEEVEAESDSAMPMH
jgi:hypothetical protein